jgi:hypothetical protein
MRSLTLSVGVLFLFSSTALGGSFDMTIHLKGGGTVTIPDGDIRRIVFANLPTGVQDPGESPLVFQLLQSSPNPFSPSTTIAYEIADAADVGVRIYDVRGALVRELVRETQAAGRHQAVWDGTDDDHARVSSGVYFYAVDCGERTLTQKLILVK